MLEEKNIKHQQYEIERKMKTFFLSTTASENIETQPSIQFNLFIQFFI